MKTTLRIFRIISKLLLLAYVTIVNFVFITVFYALLLSILRHIWPAYIPGLFDEGVIPYLVNTLPYYLLLLFILYSISPLNVWVLRKKRKVPSFEQFRSHETGTVTFRNGYEPETETLS